MSQVFVTSGNSTKGSGDLPRTNHTQFLKVKSREPHKRSHFLILITTRNCFKPNKTCFNKYLINPTSMNKIIWPMVYYILFYFIS